MAEDGDKQDYPEQLHDLVGDTVGAAGWRPGQSGGGGAPRPGRVRRPAVQAGREQRVLGAQGERPEEKQERGGAQQQQGRRQHEDRQADQGKFAKKRKVMSEDDNEDQDFFEPIA